MESKVKVKVQEGVQRVEILEGLVEPVHYESSLNVKGSINSVHEYLSKPKI